MSEPHHPKTKEFMEAELESWNYVFEKLREHDERIKTLEEKPNE